MVLLYLLIMPKFLDKSPLHSVILEIRFKSQVPDDAVLGMIYTKLAVGNKNIQSIPLPASQLPMALRQQDPNLKYTPTQRIVLQDQTINIGSNVISLEANNSLKSKTYPGWDVFNAQFKKLLSSINFISEIERIGLRYVNFFQEENLLSQLNVELKTGWESKGIENKSTIVFFVEKADVKSKVTIACDAAIQDEAGHRKGQIIDIDAFIENGILVEDLQLRVKEAHDLAKEIFYSLPKKVLLDKMSPHE